MYWLRPLTLRRALQMRVIRNTCAEFMTHNSSQISVAQQIWWYFRHYLPKAKLGKLVGKVFYVDETPIGYELIDYSKPDRAYLTAGLTPAWRGKGLGGFMFQDMVLRAEWQGRTCWLEVWADNTRAVRLYQKLGFFLHNERIVTKRTVLVMRKPSTFLMNHTLST